MCEFLVVAREIWFPDQGSNPGPYIRSTESEPLDHQARPGDMVLNEAGTLGSYTLRVTFL